MRSFFALILLCSSVCLAQAPAPQAGGSITVAIATDPPGFDPTISTSQEIARVVYNNIYEGLVRFDANGEIVPALAESWEISDDGLRWTFHLRPNVMFHHGLPLQAKDVVAKFRRAMDPESGHTNHAYYRTIASVEADEAGEHVVFTLREPHISLLYDLARADSVIYPADLQGSQRISPIGTGPFKLISYDEGARITLARFEDYYREGLPYLDEVIFRILPDDNARSIALRNGELDLAGVAPEVAVQLENNPRLKLSSGTATAEVTLALNNSRAPLDDVRVRQAISHAIDKTAIVEGAMFGYGTVIGSHATPAEGYYRELEPYPYDPERARALLREAGYSDGLELSLALPAPYPLERRSGQVIAQQLAEVGIKVDIAVVEWGVWIARIFGNADYDMTIIGHAEPRDLAIYADPNYYYRYDNPIVQQLLISAERVSSLQAQDTLYSIAARLIAEDAVNVWVFSPPYLLAAQQDIYGYWQNLPIPSMDMSRVYRAE